MRKKIEPTKIKNRQIMQEAFTIDDAIKEANRCLLCQDAPCSQGCPAGTDPGKFIRQIKFENYLGAARTIKNNNPLGSVCAMVCPTDKLCEKNCSLCALEDPINIRGLQHFACNYAKNMDIELISQPTISKEKIAIIGAGPAGISCAAELAKMGYAVTLFEKEDAIGGVARWGIPAYRLDNAAIDHDAENLLKLGVTICYNSPIELSDANLTKLAQEYKAIFLGLGLSVAAELPIFRDCTNAITATEFLRTAKTTSKSLSLQNKIVTIIGGGSVAMDAATTAAALGAKKVYAISLEGLAELPADNEEIEIAHAMHVIFKPNSQITNVIASNNAVTALVGQETAWINPNDFTPGNAKAIPGTEFSLPIDLIVQAIGNKPTPELQQLTALRKTPHKNTINVANDYATSIPGVFAGGDIVNGGATVVQAIADGKAAAKSINNYVINLANSGAK